jgi:hypothetical protein
MPELIALRAAFGQDEANYGIRRYRVGGDGLVHVPVEAALFLVDKGGFAVAETTVAQVPGGSLRAPLPWGTRFASDPSSRVHLHHDSTGGCSNCGSKHRGNQNRDVLVPAEAAGDPLVRGILPATQGLRPPEGEVGPQPIGLERSSVGDATSTAAPQGRG